MWWILSGLLILIAWTLFFILQGALPIWIPIVVTATIGSLMLALFIYRRFRAGMAAGALEKAIAAQGAQQALNARPERRAEIQELQKQVQTGINALKASKLGAGRRSGAAALYSLPWYVIIGPPGAGKTTALKHSGLVFPYQAAGGSGGVRGVGGTRNCDWWFTNEAILLDTAGRYTTESDDRDEWLAFLQMLRKYRSRRPINGVLVAISTAELIDANEQQLEATGKKIRARIDEVMTQLHMVVPVYLLFTKCDLVAGFNEFFGDLRKSDRAQAWGTTLKLDLNKNEPGRIFDAEFDTLTKQIHARALKRLAMERSREARERIYQFPLEFSGIKRNLSEVVANIFQVNAFQGTPIFRGFYFTSGTQEGRPLDRVLARMGYAMGIRPPETALPRVVESKSYFLHDVFMNVVFPDGDIAARSAGELQRQLLMRIAVSAAAATLAIIVAIPGVVSFSQNRALIKDTEDRVRAANAINWADGRPASDKVVLLKPLLERLEEFDKYRDDGLPLGMGWSMYRGDELYRPTVAAYVNLLQQGLVVPCKLRLEDKLKRVTGNDYIRERLDLKTYLMISDVEHLDVDWETGKLTSLWAEILRPTSSIAESDLRERLRPHVRYYLRLLKDKQVAPVVGNAETAERARKMLMSVPVPKRYYDFFVNSLIEEKYREDGENVRNNRKYPPLNLAELFTDRPDVLKLLTSARYQKEKRWKEVEGPYTDKGHYAVLKNMADGAGLLERERWVVPLTADETPERIPVNMRRLADDYEQQYIEQWTNWLIDLTVVPPATVKEAVEVYATLSRPDWAYVRILRQLEDHTQWKKPPEELEKAAAAPLNRKLNEKLTQQTGGLRFNIDIKKMGDKVSAIPGVFRRTVEFAIPQAGSTGPNVDTPLAKYISRIDALHRLMQKADDTTPNLDPRLMNEPLEDAIKEANALLQPFDDKAKTVLTPLLLSPLRIVSSKLPPAPGRPRVGPGAPPTPQR